MWTVSIMVTSAAYLLPGTRTPGPGTFTASTPFSPFSNIKLQVSPSLTLQRCLLELFFFRADWYTNTSSLVLFLLKKITSVSYAEPFYCSKNLHCDEFLVPAGRCCRCEATGATAPHGAAGLGLGLDAYGCSDGDWGQLRQLWLLGEMGVLLRAPRGRLSIPTTS